MYINEGQLAQTAYFSNNRPREEPQVQKQVPLPQEYPELDPAISTLSQAIFLTPFSSFSPPLHQAIYPAPWTFH